MRPPSTHVEPRSILQTARHYIRELIYGATDGLVTTFAVVAGVEGGALSLRVVWIVGAANLLADGMSMAVGTYLSIRTHESVLEVEDLPQEETFPLRHAVATFLAFVVAGFVPMIPYGISPSIFDRFLASTALTLAALFCVGASRSFITNVPWFAAGLEMLGLGGLVAMIAFGCGSLVSYVVK